MELATIRRYLRALDALAKHPSPEVRAFAKDLIYSIIDHPASEILGPIHTLPISKLTPNERLLRMMAK